MNKKSIITALLALVTLAGQVKGKVVVWEQPTTEYGNSYGDGFFNLVLDVTKVELKTDETVVYVTAQQRSDYPDFSFQFAGDTYLKVGEQRYTITSADNIELNKFVQTNKDGKRYMAFHFPPLPQGTKSFDFIEGNGERAFQIKGIKPVEERWKQLFPSYWCNEQGDWKIAFLEDCAIYDCKFWDYEQRDVNPKTGEATIVMRNGGEEIRVTVGKDKKGKRQIQIDNQKAVYQPIPSRLSHDGHTHRLCRYELQDRHRDGGGLAQGYARALQEPEDLRVRLRKLPHRRAGVCPCRLGLLGTLQREDSRSEQYRVPLRLAPLLPPHHA